MASPSALGGGRAVPLAGIAYVCALALGVGLGLGLGTRSSPSSPSPSPSPSPASWRVTPSDSTPPPPLPQAGAAAYVYGVFTATPGSSPPTVTHGEAIYWQPNVTSFNTRNDTTAPLSIMFVDTGDMEYWPTALPPQGGAYPPGCILCTYLQKSANDTLRAWKTETPGVDYVMAVVGAFITGAPGNPWVPAIWDTTLFSDENVTTWARYTAEVYCTSDYVDGVQMDLEPYGPKYAPRTILFLSTLSLALRQTSNNCVNAAHPHGRGLATFMSAASVFPPTNITGNVFEALGPNGFVVISGYDLGVSVEDDPTAEPVADYTKRLTLQVTTIVAAAQRAQPHGWFMVGIPAAASTTEFQTAVTPNGVVVAEGNPQLQYAAAAIDVLARFAVNQVGYLGPALYGFRSSPYDKFHPLTPFTEPGEEAYLAANLSRAL